MTHCDKKRERGLWKCGIRQTPVDMSNSVGRKRFANRVKNLAG